MHGVTNEVPNNSIVCQEENCEGRFQTLCELRTHLSSFHEFKDLEKCEALNFEKYSDFQQWLGEEEKRSNVKFIIHSKTKNKNNVHVSFWCNRSGFYKSTVESRKRQLKAQGSMKIGFHCTAAVLVRDFFSHVEVSYYKEHYKHEKQLCHLPLPKVDKDIIAGKLLSGIGEKHILQEIRQSPSTSFERKHLTTIKDLHNVKRDYGLILPNSGSVIKNDEMSVYTWVQKMQNEKDNPVLLYKRQDDPHPTIPNKDFMLVLMTNFQKCMMYQLGADRICIDSTHNISNYNFQLTTILVIDEFEEGIPAAYCISSVVNTNLLIIFFECIKKALASNVNPSIFMSDDAIMFKNAWVNVFGPCHSYLLCSWHVDRAWRKKIQCLNKDIQEDVYKTLKTLMFELDEKNFKQMLDSFCEMLHEDEGTKVFYDYFLTFYYPRSEMWAYCYRKAARINTNMHIENFHRCLKHIYLEGKKTKRVDKVIFELMRLTNDKKFDNYIKKQKGKITKKSTQHYKRHWEAKRLKASFKKVEENEWEVSSKKVYTVVRKHSCDETCLIACRNCILCLKSYTCTCQDYMISNFLCKHIHFIAMNISQPQNFNGPLNKSISSISMETSAAIVSESDILESNKITLGMVYNKLKSFTTMDDSVSKQMKNHIDALKHLLEVQSKCSSPCQPKVVAEPSNKKIIRQKRFYSVKKSHTNKKIKLSKPDSAEIEAKKNVLLKKKMLHSANEFDHCYYK